MPFEIVRNDITNMHVDVIVNTANPKSVIGLGVDSAIHEKAGPRLLIARQEIGSIACGSAAITPAFDLDAKYVIHTVGPIYSGKEKDASDLRNCYWNSLELAAKNDVHSIAFPAISTGVYGYPVLEATMIAINTVRDWLKENSLYDLKVVFVCFDERTYNCYREELEK